VLESWFLVSDSIHPKPTFPPLAVAYPMTRNHVPDVFNGFPSFVGYGTHWPSAILVNRPRTTLPSFLNILVEFLKS
jgi:hypothetical protein